MVGFSEHWERHSFSLHYKVEAGLVRKFVACRLVI
jgi:hypothetical protein